MNRHPHPFRLIPHTVFVLAATSLIAGLVLAKSQEGAKADKSDKPAATAPPAAAPAPAAALEYVGSDTCAGCHEDIAKSFKRNPHSILETGKRKGWEGKACEACHGPGSKHADTNSPDDIRSPLRLAPAKVDAICLACHKNQPTQVGRLQGSHARNEVPCTSCHNMHKSGPESSETILKHTASLNKLCAGCHTDVWASFQKPNHHRLPEGAMSCVSCHNPHGSMLSHNLRAASASREPACVDCHSDKKGPFVFDHAPVTNESCSTCHEPHGSVNPRMLTRANVSLLCLECHANLPTPTQTNLGNVPPAFHDTRSARFQNCTICHQKIHGSNADRGLTR